MTQKSITSGVLIGNVIKKVEDNETENEMLSIEFKKAENRIFSYLKPKQQKHKWNYNFRINNCCKKNQHVQPVKQPEENSEILFQTWLLNEIINDNKWDRYEF